MTRVRVALVGLGGVAERIHLPALREVPDADLVGSCEPDAQRRARVTRAFGLANVFEDAGALLDATRPDIVVIGTPPDSHARLCLLALERGAHVFCEKPFVSTMAEADEVVAAAERTGRRVGVNNQYRYMRMYAVTKDRLARGDFGRPILLQCWQQMYHPPAREKNWRARLVQSTLFEFGTHALDLICVFFDSLPLSINVHTPRPRPEFEADVIVTAMLRFPDERIATMVFNRISHAPERYLEMRLDCEQASVRVSLGGVARAAVDWSKARRRPVFRGSFVRGGEARVEQGGRSRVIAREPNQAFASATASNLRAFVKAVVSGTRSTADVRHARELMRVVFAGYESARTGETVWLRREG